MIYDILEKFEDFYKQYGDKVIVDSYSLKDGLYVKIDKNGVCKYFISKTIKKEKVFESVNSSTNKDAEYWFKQVDYMSGYLNSNKSLFDKKIHNINYLSLFFKIDNFEYVQEKLREHFLILLSYKKFSKKEEKLILNDFCEYISKFGRKKEIARKYKILKSKYDEILQVAKEHDIKNYIKIFFDEDIDIYKKESEIYLTLKIFNDNKYNQLIDKNVFGLSNSNMGLNQKKPFLEHKTRKSTLPFVLKSKDALMLKSFFDWLKNQPYTNEQGHIDRYLDEEHFFIQKRSNNDEAEITEFDYIPTKLDDVEKQFQPFEIENFMKIVNKDKKLIKNIEIKSMYMLELEIDRIFYNKQLKFNYFKDAKDIKTSAFLSKKLQTILLITRQSMINYFRKFDDSSFLQNIKKYSDDMSINHLLEGRTILAKESINLKYSILKKYKEEIMDIDKMKQNMTEKLEKSDYGELKIEEFFYLCGQMIWWLLDKNRSHEKNADLLEPFLRANNSQKLKKDIEFTYIKYKHAIRLHNKKVNNALSLILDYKGKDKLSEYTDTFLVGVLSSNIFFTKTDKGEE